MHVSALANINITQEAAQAMELGFHYDNIKVLSSVVSCNIHIESVNILLHKYLDSTGWTITSTSMFIIFTLLFMHLVVQLFSY